MTTEFWIGALVSIPLGIGTSLLTPKVQSWIDNRSKAAALNAKQRSQSLYHQTVSYSLHPDAFTQVLVADGIRMILPATTMVAATTMFACTLLATKLAPSHFLGRFLSWFPGVCLLFVLYGTFSLLFRYSHAIRALWRVQNFEKYAEKIPIDLRREVEEAFPELNDEE
jgi:hypothetical protein